MTSGWNPTTNGKQERLNRVTVDTLRKLSENDTSKWNLWIPSVMISYNSRVNSNTNFSPFELIFGRSMNTFENYRVLPAASDLNNLIERCEEINKLVNQTLPKALKNLKEKQEVQKMIQEERNNVSDQILKPGTFVM